MIVLMLTKVLCGWVMNVKKCLVEDGDIVVVVGVAFATLNTGSQSSSCSWERGAGGAEVGRGSPVEGRISRSTAAWTLWTQWAQWTRKGSVRHRYSTQHRGLGRSTQKGMTGMAGMTIEGGSGKAWRGNCPGRWGDARGLQVPLPGGVACILLQ